MPSELLNLLYAGKREEAGKLEPADIFDAAALGAHQEVAALLREDASRAQAWSDDGFTALHYACFFGTPEVVTDLLEAGADANVPSRNDMGVRPINAAAAGRHAFESIVILLTRGRADVDGEQASGHTALDEARLRGDQQLIDLLTTRGAKS